MLGKGVSSELADAVSDGGTVASTHGSMFKCLLNCNPMEFEKSMWGLCEGGGRQQCAGASAHSPMSTACWDAAGV